MMLQAKSGSFISSRGFTLLEIIAVLLLLSVLAALVIPRFFAVDTSANSRAVDAAVSELNGREGLVWADIRVSDTEYDEVNGDDAVWAAMKYDGSNSYPNLGAAYRWTSGPDQDGGELSFKESPSVPLARTASTRSKPARWSR
jgi:prepilin-type N-terminal cleavage/methylation domain-containing protein